MRILVVSDFSGRPVAERPPLAKRPTHKVDVDTLDAVMQRIGPRLRMAADEIALRSIDDFHPDALFRRAALFEALRRTRENRHRAAWRSPRISVGSSVSLQRPPRHPSRQPAVSKR